MTKQNSSINRDNKYQQRTPSINFGSISVLYQVEYPLRCENTDLKNILHLLKLKSKSLITHSNLKFKVTNFVLKIVENQSRIMNKNFSHWNTLAKNLSDMVAPSIKKWKTIIIFERSQISTNLLGFFLERYPLYVDKILTKIAWISEGSSFVRFI
jgi:hypothetical protein